MLGFPIRETCSSHDLLSLTSAGQSTDGPERAQDCLRDLFLTDPLEDKKALERKKGDRAVGTCELDPRHGRADRLA